MAKLTFVNPLLSKYRSTGGDNTFIRSGAVVRRIRGHAKFKRTTRRSVVNQAVHILAARWAGISDVDKAGWSAYAALVSGLKNGYAAFFAHNSRISNIDPLLFSVVDSISSPPAPPDAPAGLCFAYMQASGSFCVTWTSPLLNTLALQVFEHLPPGLSRSSAQRWKYVSSCWSNTGVLSLPVTFLDTGRNAQLSARVLNARGEISTNGLYTTTTKTGQQASFYGYVYYGYCVYTTTKTGQQASFYGYVYYGYCVYNA